MTNARAFGLNTLSASILLSLSVASGAQAPATPPAAGAPPAGANGAPAGGQVAPQGTPRPFKDIIKDAKETAGFFTIYEKDEKVWIAIKPDQFEKPFFFTYNIPQSIGERGLYGSQMGGSELVYFKKIGNQIQLIAKNTEFFAKPGSPQAQFVSEAFSDSLMASAAAASAPQPDSKAVLVELNALLFADIPGYSTRLEAAFRMPFALDARNTSFSRVNNSDKLTGVQVKAHFSVPKLSAPPLTPSPVPTPPPPRTTPDPRSLFVSFYYSFSQLPETEMVSRIADDRLGHFVTSRSDYSEDLTPKDKIHLVNRWRLEKKDAAAALSEPKEPITYWLDKNIPQKYRKAVTDGVLEWNKAFEKVGFKNAVVVKQQTDKDNFDTMDARHASIRWFVGADVGFAIGPSHKDPRTGEILDADIGMSDVFARGARRQLAEDVGMSAQMSAYTMGNPLTAHKDFPACNYANESAHEMHFAMDLLEARGMEMDSPEAEVVAQAYVKDVIMHEVGHTLGLRHNFRASTIYSMKQIQDPEFTKQNGLTGSIMDYTPFNLATSGEKQAEYVMSTLGPYDYWAIEYAYKPIDAAREKEELAKIAARSTEPLLAFATDEEAITQFGGMDPEVNQFDLGADPLEYYKKRIKLSRELWDRLQNLKLKDGEGYDRLTRSFNAGFTQLSRVAPLAAKYVGGVKMVRDHAGTNRPVFAPTPAARQREALAIITDSLFKVDSFKFKPEFVSRIGVDFLGRRLDFSGGAANTDPNISTRVLNVQKAVLDVVMSDGVALRMLESQEKVAEPAKLLKLSDVYDTLQNAIWSELKTGGEITSLRRNLQREHVKRISAALVRASGNTPADARSLQRENAVQLQGMLRAAQAKPLSKEAKAHLADSLNTLSEALKAPLQRAGV
ncbi:MAG: zinc-dependent metalloprotease [Usitatibacteraceae bacterium]